MSALSPSGNPSGSVSRSIPLGSPTVAQIARIALLPARVAVAFSRTTLQLGRLVAEEGPILRAGGFGERLSQLNDLSAPERPLGRLLAREGTLDRLLAEDATALQRAAAPLGDLAARLPMGRRRPLTTSGSAPS